MTDILQAALAAIPSLVPKREIRYSRGDDFVILNATVGATRIDYRDENGIRLKSEVRDYLIKPADLIIADNLTEPVEGDEIIDTNEDAATRTYTVMGIEAGEPWRWTDRYHIMYRVHTRQTDEA